MPFGGLGAFNFNGHRGIHLGPWGALMLLSWAWGIHLAPWGHSSCILWAFISCGGYPTTPCFKKSEIGGIVEIEFFFRYLVVLYLVNAEANS